MKVDFLINMGGNVYDVDIKALLEEGESSVSIIEFLWIDVDIISRRIDKHYWL